MKHIVVTPTYSPEYEGAGEADLGIFTLTALVEALEL